MCSYGSLILRAEMFNGKVKEERLPKLLEIFLTSLIGADLWPIPELKCPTVKTWPSLAHWQRALYGCENGGKLIARDFEWSAYSNRDGQLFLRSVSKVRGARVV